MAAENRLATGCDNSPKEKHRNFAQSPIVSVYVGSPRELFNVHYDTAVAASEYFGTSLKPDTFKESNEYTVELEEQDAATFAIIVNWMYEKRLPPVANSEFKITDAVAAYKLADYLTVDALKNALVMHLRRMFSARDSSWLTHDLCGDVWNGGGLPELQKILVTLVQEYLHFRPNDRERVLEVIDDEEFLRCLLRRPFTEKVRKLGDPYPLLLDEVVPSFGDYLTELLLKHHPLHSAEYLRSPDTEESDFNENDTIRRTHQLFVAPVWFQFEPLDSPAIHFKWLARQLVKNLFDLEDEYKAKLSELSIKDKGLQLYFSMARIWINKYLVITCNDNSSLHSDHTSACFNFDGPCFTFSPSKWASAMIFLIYSSQMFIEALEDQAFKAFHDRVDIKHYDLIRLFESASSTLSTLVYHLKANGVLTVKQSNAGSGV